MMWFLPELLPSGALQELKEAVKLNGVPDKWKYMMMSKKELHQCEFQVAIKYLKLGWTSGCSLMADFKATVICDLGSGQKKKLKK